MSNHEDDSAEPDDEQPSSVLRPVDGDDASPTEMIHRVERFMGMMQVGSRSESLIEKLDTSQISQVIDNAEKDSVRQHTLDQKQENSRRFYALTVCFVVFAICWLFLGYNKTEHIDAVISAIVGLLGGYGLGKANAV